jgi:hypothetical protein
MTVHLFFRNSYLPDNFIYVFDTGNKDEISIEFDFRLYIYIWNLRMNNKVIFSFPYSYVNLGIFKIGVLLISEKHRFFSCKIFENVDL